MGGLRKQMPITFWTYIIGTLALAGIFPLAGFWSKDEILAKAFNIGITDGRKIGIYAFVLLLIAAFFTAFYMWRQINLVFLGQPRSHAATHAPESNRLMTIPLIILAVLTIFGGLLNIPFQVPALPFEALTLWLEESVTWATGGVFNLGLAIGASAVALAGIVLAHLVYGRQPLTAAGLDPLQANPASRPAFSLATAKLYWDELYGALIEQPFNRLSKWLADVVDWGFWHDYVHNNLIRDGFNGTADALANPIDKGLVDRFFLGFGAAAAALGNRLRRTQTGYVRTYVFTVLLGVLVVLFVILFPLIRQLLQR
jgi:NADH-quinone oxidoreductase subunit L